MALDKFSEKVNKNLGALNSDLILSEFEYVETEYHTLYEADFGDEISIDVYTDLNRGDVYISHTGSLQDSELVEAVNDFPYACQAVLDAINKKSDWDEIRSGVQFDIFGERTSYESGGITYEHSCHAIYLGYGSTLYSESFSILLP